MLNINNRLVSLAKKNEFNPGFLGLFLNPFYFARKYLYKEIKSNSKYFHGKVLDIGCGCKPYRILFKNVDSYVGVDIKKSGHNHITSTVDVFYNGEKLPFNNEEFDGIVCFEVLEHVFNPDVFLSEINRVLKRGGQLLITMPFVWDEHEQPYDYARYSSFGIKYLLKKYGFNIVKSSKTGNNFSVISQLVNNYFYKVIIRKGSKMEIFIDLVISSVVNVFGLFFSYILPKNDDLYLDNILLMKKW